MSEPQRILVIKTLYLGDLIHTLPLINALRARYPSAQLDVLVREPHVALMRQVSSINGVLAMDPKRHRGLRGLLALCGQLRKARYDLVLNPGASDRASILTALSGGRHRIGRLNRNQSRHLWPLLHDEVIDRGWNAEPMYWQKLSAFAEPLQLERTVCFGLDCTGIDLSALALPPQYLHLSPFASEDLRSLPPATVLELAAALRRRWPALGLVVSCGPSPRETERLALLRPALDALGVRCLAGEVDLPTLAALISGASLHIGPDSGPLHLAVALGVPAVGCFLYKDGSAEWLPTGVQYRTVGVTEKLLGGLYGIETAKVIAAAETLLDPAR